jgi:hypothetical protein
MKNSRTALHGPVAKTITVNFRSEHPSIGLKEQENIESLCKEKSELQPRDQRAKPKITPGQI